MFEVTAWLDIKPIFGNMTKEIKDGETVMVNSTIFYNGELWYILVDGTEVPETFFLDRNLTRKY